MHILRGFSMEQPPEQRRNNRRNKTAYREKIIENEGRGIRSVTQ